MPNWCYNTVRVEGDTNALETFITSVKGVEEGECTLFSFNTIIPMPKELAGTSSPIKTFTTIKEVEEHNARCPDFEGRKIGLAITKAMSRSRIKKYGFDNWYDWCCENWDTKWPAGDVTLDEFSNHLTYQFTTAWGPSQPIFDYLCTEHPDLKITWEWDGEEPGVGGNLTIEEKTND
jgi:hypothetical protein